MVRKVFLVSFILASMSWHAQGQLIDILFPTIANTSRAFTSDLSSQPVLQKAAQSYGNLLVSSVNFASRIPLSIARNLGTGNLLPSIFNNRNKIDDIDKFMSDYRLGLTYEDAKLSIDAIITKYGHPVEIHKVITEDGYVLTMFRIPRNGPAVFLMHGLVGSADDYIIAGPESGIAYLLANDGYDVWMGNARGNKHSRRHVDMKPSEGQFWDFSWHEIGCYDLPAMIDYVTNSTGQEKIKYIGHSQGTTSFFVMTSQRPEYNEKVSLMVALSPVAFMSHLKSPLIRMMAPGGTQIHGFLKAIGAHEFLPDNNINRMLKSVMCGLGPLSDILCSNVMFLLAGFDADQMNVTNLGIMLGHMPSGAATKQFAHYGQGVVTGKFRQFDYGVAENLKMYGSRIPPDYPLKNVKAPVSLFYAEEDWMSDPIDVDELYNVLPNAVDIYKIPHKDFNHVDFLTAKDLKTLVYKRLRKLMKHF